MDQQKIQWAKWRWEFMRRNDELRNDYMEVKNIRVKASPQTPYFLTPEGEKEREICTKWDLRISIMPDPNRSFDELVEEGLDFDNTDSSSSQVQWAQRLLNIWLLTGGLDSDAVKVEKERTHANHLTVKIDFNKVNSLDALKRIVSELLERYFHFQEPEYIEMRETEFMGMRAIELVPTKKEKKTQKYMTDYDVILKVGDMKIKERLKNQQIAKIIDPRKYKTNAESATRSVSYLFKRYKALVDGGYRNITYP